MTNNKNKTTDNIDCDHDWEFVDDSFDHEFGTEQVYYYYCTKCDATKSYDGHSSDDNVL